MPITPSTSGHEELAQKVEKMTRLVSLIQEFPAEAQLVMAAVEDGLTLGPAQIMDAARREMKPPAEAGMAAAGTCASWSPPLTEEPAGLPDAGLESLDLAGQAGSGTD